VLAIYKGTAFACTWATRNEAKERTAMEPKPITVPTRISPYTVPAEQQGWRGLGVPEVNAKRRAYTLLWNEQVLVCALLLLPGERSIRHSHETGELSITFADALHPTASYTPGGLLHGGDREPQKAATDTAQTDALKAPGDGPVAELLAGMLQEQKELRRMLEELRAPAAGPRVLVDILFPPFKTTVDDPAYAEKRTIVGPWYD
jgi:hypothetical protein